MDLLRELLKLDESSDPVAKKIEDLLNQLNRSHNPPDLLDDDELDEWEGGDDRYTIRFFIKKRIPGVEKYASKFIPSADGLTAVEFTCTVNGKEYKGTCCFESGSIRVNKV